MAGALGAGQLGGRAVQHEEGRVAGGAGAGGPAHLDVGQREGADAGAERLHDRLLGCEARRQALGHVGRAGGVGLLGLGEAARREARTAVEQPAEARHVDRVDADADDGAHSTVTVLARLRGRSGSCPCSRANR